jgi:hypothetical protein
MATPQPTKKTVADLKTNILNPSLTSTYETTLVFPTAVQQWINSSRGAGGKYDSTKLENVQLSCREVSLPGTSLATHEMLNDFTGVRERHAYRRQYDDTASFGFYVDVNYDSILLFENWIKFIVNEDASDFDLDNRNYTYRVKFPNDYKSDIYIKKFERDYKDSTLEYKFLNAYPLSINTMPLSYDQSQVLICTVNFSFSRYVVNSKKFTSPGSSTLATDEEIRAYADDTGRSLRDAETILNGGFIETTIG